MKKVLVVLAFILEAIVFSQALKPVNFSLERDLHNSSSYAKLQKEISPIISLLQSREKLRAQLGNGLGLKKPLKYPILGKTMTLSSQSPIIENRKENSPQRLIPRNAATKPGVTCLSGRNTIQAVTQDFKESSIKAMRQNLAQKEKIDYQSIWQVFPGDNGFCGTLGSPDSAPFNRCKECLKDPEKKPALTRLTKKFLKSKRSDEDKREFVLDAAEYTRKCISAEN